MERDASRYVDMLQDLDTEVGRVLDAIDQAGLRENTVIVFVSDNGGLQGAANMGPLRGAKSTTLEGGIRVPLIIRWPGHINANTKSQQVSVTFDLTRSFLQLAGADMPADRLDGYDIIDHVTQRRDDFSRTLFWRGERGDRTWWVVRDGDAKYVRKTAGGQTDQWLFDLSSDIGEQNNLLDTRSADTNRLQRLLGEWEANLKPVQ